MKEEYDILSRVTAVERTLHAVFEQEQRLIEDQTSKIEKQLADGQDTLRTETEEALELHNNLTDAQREGRKETRTMSTLWPEMEEYAVAVDRAELESFEMKRRLAQEEDTLQEKLDNASSVYELYAAATGIRWDSVDDGQVRGYVAVDSVRHFDIDRTSARETADALWEEIEAALTGVR
eukprot:CAMPEP_0194510630 /NCGR_PEP_ID=MMETSP0253-20130528/42022_1 /TAXON_ID=2966 /ORGANISM="Noctiluca scintillans" /LENGTH=178 /DNA_ID=CAMNT_0039353887 /DNA_START=33 /DNA_END=569 /DNA_ORIENTATION=-